MQRVRMDIDEREVAKDKAQLVPELLLNRSHDGRGLAGIRAFVVTILHQDDSGGCRPLTVVSFTDRDRKTCSLCHDLFPLPDIFFRYTSDVCGMTNRSSKLEHHLVDVTPAPVLPWLEGLDNRVSGRVEMLGGVLILRRVTAADMST